MYHTDCDCKPPQSVMKGLLEFIRQILVTYIVDEVILNTGIMKAYGFVVDLREMAISSEMAKTRKRFPWETW